MSDLEKQTTLLNLELKKERVANEIAAVRAERARAQEEERLRREEEERKRIEWENEQKRLMIEEQRKLKEAEIAAEKLRQEKIVKAYKQTMLTATQKWIKKNAEIYAELAKKEETIKQLMSEYKGKFETLEQKVSETKANAEAARTRHDKSISELENRIADLKAQLEAEIEKARQAALGPDGKKNPFASDGPVEQIRMSAEYAIMEIIGQGDDLAAKLINQEGDVFMVRVGTTLRNGYTVDEISQTYLSATKDGERDYLYFSAGGILDQEPVKSGINLKDTVPSSSSSDQSSEPRSRGGAPARAVVTTQGIPSLGKGMIVR